MIGYTLTRSKRKTVGIHVNSGRVEVRAPREMPKSEIDRIVMSKEKWITDKLAILDAQTRRRDSFELDYGGLVTYRGRRYPIVPKSGGLAGFDDSAFYMPPDLPPESIKSLCVKIYGMLARRDLLDKTLAFAERMSVMPSNVRVNSAKTRWGSCSGRKSINYSWRLIMAEDDVIDYVVVHELAHLTEMNHSERFWAIVGGILPDYRERQAKLKALQKRLSSENWD